MLYILAGIILLYFGAEGLVRGSSRLAAHFGIPPLVIGLTIVGHHGAAASAAGALGSDPA